ncbi:MAG: sucrose phosphorylase [Candidatus Moranbacteria bacterium]|nr:sucrose phosphorylase [Candidatus Moranbacteria bacterium]
MKKLKNKIQLITYPDSLGRDLKDLDLVLNKYLKEVVYGVHILPMYPSSSDRGFSPLTHLKIDEKFGDWDDIIKIGKKFDLVVDLVVNHISSQSKYFLDYLEKGDASQYADFFITTQKFSKRMKWNQKLSPKVVNFIEKILNIIRHIDIIFHKGGVNRITLKKIFRPRPGSPFVTFKFQDKTKKNLWCTFSSDQLDLDIKNEKVLEIFKNILSFFKEKKVKMVRLDAVGYAAKERDTRNFMIPQTYKFIAWLSDQAHQNGILALPEVHSHYTNQLGLAKIKEVDYVYDFALPVLVLEAIHGKNASNLKKWIKIRPTNCITTLDTHDGLPIPDVEDLIEKKSLDSLVALIKSFGGNEAFRASGRNSDNVDIYQLNCTYFSALGENKNAYLIARAIQFFLPGIPQVYYVGLLAGENDMDLLERTGHGRDINRHYYSIAEIEKELKRDVVKRLFALMKFRNEYEAFNGKFKLYKSAEDIIVMGWTKNKLRAKLEVYLKKKEAKITYWDQEKNQEKYINI